MEFFDAGRYIAGLLFTVGLIFGLWYLARKYMPALLTGAPANDRKTLKISESLALDPRRRVVVVNSGAREHIVLLGITHDLLIESRDAVPAPDHAEPIGGSL